MTHVNIIVGSVYGGSEMIAELAQKRLKRAGHQASIMMNATLADVHTAENLLFISATTGQGDLPNNIVPLVNALTEQAPDLSRKSYGLIACGDRGYGKTYCQGGRKVLALLTQLNAQSLLPHLEVDATEYLDPEEPVLPWLANYIGCLA